MQREELYELIEKMHIELSNILERNNYNLLSEEVVEYSKRLDRVLNSYNKKINN